MLGEAAPVRKKTFAAARLCDYGIESKREGVSGRDSAGVQMLIDDFAGSVRAGTTAATHGQPTLHFEQGARAFIHSLTDLAIGYRVTNANVHRLLLPLKTGDREPQRVRPNTGANKNDCQLYRTT
jgi:hypothetical protein